MSLDALSNNQGNWYGVSMSSLMWYQYALSVLTRGKSLAFFQLVWDIESLLCIEDQCIIQDEIVTSSQYFLQVSDK